MRIIAALMLALASVPAQHVLAQVPAAEGTPARPDTVEFSSGTLRLRGLVWRPAGRGPFPAVLFNHGSGKETYEREMAAIGPTYASHGYVLFWPYRRGQGLSAGRGEWIGDALKRASDSGGMPARSKAMTTLLSTEQLGDALAALAFLKRMRDVDSTRIAVAGNSFGGITTMFLAAKAPGIHAAVASAAAAQTWAASPEIREKLIEAARESRVPVFFLQAANDYNLDPSRTLSATMDRAGKPNTMKIYPAFGTTNAEGHAFGYLGGAIWGPDVFAFLNSNLHNK
jgi:carboxymethylenebutenolidase